MVGATVLNLSKRRTGRSTKIIDWLVSGEPFNKRVIVCHSVAEANRMFRQATRICNTVESWQFITLDTLPTLNGRNVESIGIDNLEFLLSKLFRYPVGYITGTVAQYSRIHSDNGFNVILNPHD